jgi:hypothetical protein
VRHVGTIPEMEEREVKENNEMGKFNYDKL